MVKLLIIIALLSLPLSIPAYASAPASPLSTQPPSEIISASEPIHTTSRFEIKTENQVIILPKQVIYQNDPNQEIGNNTVIDSGKDGTKTITYQVAYYEGQEYSRDKVDTTIVNPKNEIIDKGTKIVWRTLDTPNGPIQYWKKLHVWATQYDSHCPGCNQWTATGLPQGKGVIAVDPSVIKLGTHGYIPGYGSAIAGDTGGAVKGNMIDVGFPDAHTSGWISHYVDIYLTSGAPS